MAASSKGAVASAIAGNAFLTVAKAVAFMMTGSGAMLSEAIHSLADTANQLLLFIGIRQSERPSDALFHYGYGAERYLYALLSAVGIFVLGCGVTVYHGIRDILDPPELHSSPVAYAVLGLSFLVEGFVLLQAIRTVWAEKGDKSLARYLRETSDPTVAAVLLEDSVACAGVLVAAAGIWLAEITGNPVFDAMGAIAIGGMLGLVAVWLGVRNRTLLLGPSIPPDIHGGMEAFLKAQPSVEEVFLTRSRVVGANRFRFQAQIDFDGKWLAMRRTDVIEKHVPSLTDSKAREAFARDFGEAILGELAAEVDRIEAELAREFPRLQYVDLEVD